jgi:hypothetical protein
VLNQLTLLVRAHASKDCPSYNNLGNKIGEVVADNGKASTTESKVVWNLLWHSNHRVALKYEIHKLKKLRHKTTEPEDLYWKIWNK